MTENEQEVSFCDTEESCPAWKFVKLWYPFWQSIKHCCYFRWGGCILGEKEMATAQQNLKMIEKQKMDKQKDEVCAKCLLGKLSFSNTILLEESMGITDFEIRQNLVQRYNISETEASKVLSIIKASLDDCFMLVEDSKLRKVAVSVLEVFSKKQIDRILANFDDVCKKLKLDFSP